MNPELQELIDSANEFFRDHSLDEANADEIACLVDATLEEDALGMVDDWEARLAVPQPLCDALREWIADRHHVNARG